MVKLPAPSNTHSHEQGFSLISILIIMGVVLMAVLIVSQARVNQQSAQKAIKLKQSYTDVNQALISDIVALVHSKITAGAPCITLNAVTANMQGLKAKESSAPAYAFSNNLPVATTAPALHREARDRCSQPRVPASGNSNTDNKAYFCVRLGQDTTAPKDSIMNAELAFAEVALELIDLQTQKAISCNEYVNKKSDPKDGSAGMAVTMALYWSAKVGTKISYSQKALSYIANQN